VPKWECFTAPTSSLRAPIEPGLAVKAVTLDRLARPST
jgi:hypothetical protein